MIVDDRRFADRSEAALRVAAAAGALTVCECVLAEIRSAFAAHLQRRRGRAARVVPDFLIAAHAQLTADRLLARDRGYYRDYFKKLVLLEP